jgi:multidrug resistance efflux pump
MLTRSEAEHARTKTLHASGLIAQAGMERCNTALEVARQDAARALAEMSDRRAGLGEAQGRGGRETGAHSGHHCKKSKI